MIGYLDKQMSSPLDSWMARIPDARGLHEFSIPGTHNSCARNASIAVENQQWTLAEQLRAGIRFLDVRIGTDELDIYHGIVSLDMHWTDVAMAVVSFLATHPREAIVMRIKHEDPDENTVPQWNRWFAKHPHACPYFHHNVDQVFPIALGTVRGKVVVLNDEGARFPYMGLPYGNACLRVLDEYRVWFLPDDFPCLGVTIGKKIMHVLRALATAHGRKRQWSITYASGAVGMAPSHVADEVNAAVLAYLRRLAPHRRKAHLGTLVMDYPSVELINALIYSCHALSHETATAAAA
jgi:1-phosphatidylinositol phosphodiesterase